jgi:hypothetical protein
MDETPKVLTDYEEQNKIARNLIVFLNKFPDLPVGSIHYEYLDAGYRSMALSTIQGAYITKRYITGGHLAEYQFKIIYRLNPGSGNALDSRLKADELLNNLADWASLQKPTVGEGVTTVKLQATTRSSLFGAYENGDEDHQILMKLTYEVI